MLQNLLLLFQVAFLITCSAAAQSEGSKREGSSTETKQPALTLNGYDPVELVQGKRTKGSETLSADHQGFRYRFSSAVNREAFTSEPAKYAVQDRGLCPVAKVRMRQEVQGEPGIFSLHEGKIYLFSNQDAKRIFEANPAEFVPMQKKEGSGPR